jgi:AcrR family transcriptional regulator
MTAPVVPARRSARERLLDAADELFYAEGIHTVGIDRVIERAGVAKASLYTTFGSKDELIRAYLERRHAARQAAIGEAVERASGTRARLLAPFDAIPGTSRGCAFINASAEGERGGVVDEVSGAHRAWRRELFATLAREAGARDPETLASQLTLLYDGAAVGLRMDDAGVAAAQAAAELLVDAALR